MNHPILLPLLIALALLWPMVVWTALRIWKGRTEAREAFTGRGSGTGPSWWVLRLGWCLLCFIALWPVPAPKRPWMLVGFYLLGTGALLWLWWDLRQQLARRVLDPDHLVPRPSPFWELMRGTTRVAFALGLPVGLSAGLEGARAFHQGHPQPLRAALHGGCLGFLGTLGGCGLLFAFEGAALLARSRHRMSGLRDQALRARLAPHFIFNALATLRAQIPRDPLQAEAMAERLGTLFRQVLEVSEQATVPLERELSFVEAYLGIQQVRLGERLQVALHIPESLMEAEVPPLALQVLVENAVKHGIERCEDGGLLVVTGRRLACASGWTLSLCVSNPLPETAAPQIAPGTGTALATLRQRLAKPEDLVLERLESGFRASFTWRQP